MNEYFPKLRSFGGNVKAELDLSNYKTKFDLEKARDGDTSDFAKKFEIRY